MVTVNYRNFTEAVLVQYMLSGLYLMGGGGGGGRGGGGVVRGHHIYNSDFDT